MKRHFAQQSDSPVLSVEEEAILIDDTNQQTAELTADSQETDRLGGIVVAMNDIATVVSGAPELGQTEQALISAAADMAVAGTDTNPEEVVEGLLPAEGASTESITTTVKDAVVNLWKQVVAFIKQVWEHLKKFFTNIKNFLSPTRRKLERLEMEREIERALAKARDKEAFLKAQAEWKRLRIAEERSRLHAELNSVTLKGDTALILTVMNNNGSHKVEPTKLAQQLKETYDTHLKQYEALRSGLTGLAAILSDYIERINLKPTDITDSIRTPASTYNARFETIRKVIVQDTHNSAHCLFGSGIAYHDANGKADTFRDMPLASFAYYHAAEISRVAEVKVPPLDEASTDAIFEAIAKQCKIAEQLGQDSYMEKYRKEVERLEKALDRLVNTVMWDESYKDLAKKGRENSLDEVTAQARRMDQLKSGLVKLAKKVSTVGAITITSLTQADSKIGWAAMSYCDLSIKLRSSKIVEEGLAKFDLEHANA